MCASNGSWLLRRLLVGVLLVTVVSTAQTARAAPCWFPPVVGTVTDPYREPPCTWCAGNRNIDYRVASVAVVRAAASGRVDFVGTVVGVRYVVIRLAGGWRHTYGRLTSTPLRPGDPVVANSVVGAASATFLFGLRIGDDYADPTAFLGRLRSRPRLVPVDDTAARPAPPARPQCPAPSRRVAPPTAR